MSHCHPLEVVGRGSETQLQVGENFNYLIYGSRVNVGPTSQTASHYCLYLPYNARRWLNVSLVLVRRSGRLTIGSTSRISSITIYNGVLVTLSASFPFKITFLHLVTLFQRAGCHCCCFFPACSLPKDCSRWRDFTDFWGRLSSRRLAIVI